MGKVIFFALIAAIVWLLFFFRRPPAARAVSKPAPAEKMVVCARCGVHLPASESTRIDGLTSCRDPAACGNARDARPT